MTQDKLSDRSEPIMTDPKDVADLVARWRAICHPTSETMPDGLRLTMFVRAGDDAATTLETLSAELERVKGERDAALQYATNFLRSYVTKYCNPVPDWAPLTKLIGVLTQIDNVSTVTAEIVARAERAEASLGVAVKALRNMPCPRPCNHRPDQFDAGDCFDAGECGCVAARPLASIQAKGE
jgi:hypothetical protein